MTARSPSTNWMVYARHIRDRPQIVGWGSGLPASLYEVESMP